jgi:hypothetical protein
MNNFINLLKDLLKLSWEGIVAFFRDDLIFGFYYTLPLIVVFGLFAWLWAFIIKRVDNLHNRANSRKDWVTHSGKDWVWSNRWARVSDFVASSNLWLWVGSISFGLMAWTELRQINLGARNSFLLSAIDYVLLMIIGGIVAIPIKRRAYYYMSFFTSELPRNRIFLFGCCCAIPLIFLYATRAGTLLSQIRGFGSGILIALVAKYVATALMGWLAMYMMIRLLVWLLSIRYPPGNNSSRPPNNIWGGMRTDFSRWG